MGNPYAQQQQVYNQLVGGSGLALTKYPANAAGVALTASGNTTGAYKFAALGANVKQIVAVNTIGARWRLLGFALNTFSTTGVFVIRLGAMTTAAAALFKVIGEFVVNEILAIGPMNEITIPYGATVQPDGVNDGVGGDAASANAGQDDTVVCSVTIATGMGVS